RRTPTASVVFPQETGHDLATALLAGAHRLGAVETPLRLLAADLQQGDLLKAVDRKLNLLVHRHAARIRLDEVYYHKGRGLLLQALRKSLRVDLAPEAPLLDESLTRDVVDAFRAARGALLRSLQANPRGAFSAETHLQLGLAHRKAGVLYQQFADRYAMDGNGNAVPIYREHARRELEAAPEALRSAADLAKTPALMHRAHLELSRALADLGRTADAESVLRHLSGVAGVSPALRAEVAIQLATLLEAGGRILEAIETLSAHLSSSAGATDQPMRRAAMLRLGALYLRRGEFQAARQTYLAFERLPSPEDATERADQAEGLYHAYRLGLRLALRSNASAAIGRQSIERLRQLAERYPDLPQAADGLAAAVDYLLASERPDEALALARHGLETLQRETDRMRMRLLIGAVRRAAGAFPAAREAFSGVLASTTGDPRAHRLRAEALLGLARTAMAEARAAEPVGRDAFERAIDTYARVWAQHPTIHRIADTARAEAARHLTDPDAPLSPDERRERALAILEGVEDKASVAELRRQLEGDPRNRRPLPDEAPPAPEYYPDF
ncbi:MAG: hypothetical protein ACOCX4_07770, partial [Planctomycetota bacterium]